MSPRHKDALALLFPLDLGGAFAGDTAVEGASLDAAGESAERLLLEMFPDTAFELLPDWERVCGVSPGEEDPLQTRRDRVVRRLRELGDIKKPYYEMLAAAMGYQVHIEEYLPTMAEWACAGDELIVPDDPAVLFVWNCHVLNQPIHYFRAGQSAAGDRLSWWDLADNLEVVLQDLRPAHVWFVFTYE